MSSQKNKITCLYCSLELSNKYAYNRHIKENKYCIEIRETKKDIKAQNEDSLEINILHKQNLKELYEKCNNLEKQNKELEDKSMCYFNENKELYIENKRLYLENKQLYLETKSLSNDVTVLTNENKNLKQELILLKYELKLNTLKEIDFELLEEYFSKKKLEYYTRGLNELVKELVDTNLKKCLIASEVDNILTWKYEDDLIYDSGGINLSKKIIDILVSYIGEYYRDVILYISKLKEQGKDTREVLHMYDLFKSFKDNNMLHMYRVFGEYLIKFSV